MPWGLLTFFFRSASFFVFVFDQTYSLPQFPPGYIWLCIGFDWVHYLYTNESSSFCSTPKVHATTLLFLVLLQVVISSRIVKGSAKKNPLQRNFEPPIACRLVKKPHWLPAWCDVTPLESAKHLNAGSQHNFHLLFFFQYIFCIYR